MKTRTACVGTTNDAIPAPLWDMPSMDGEKTEKNATPSTVSTVCSARGRNTTLAEGSSSGMLTGLTIDFRALVKKDRIIYSCPADCWENAVPRSPTSICSKRCRHMHVTRSVQQHLGVSRKHLGKKDGR